MLKKRIKALLSNILWFLPDEQYCKLTYLMKHKRLPNLTDPKYINDKLLYLKLNERDLKLKQMVDKYEVRNYVKAKVGEEYLVPLIGVYSDPKDVDFKKLPKKFALKPTSGAQQNLICKDKSKVDWETSKKKIDRWLKFDPYKRTREWPYKGLKSRFIIEEFLEDSNGNTFDYKFWCFNGVPKILQVDVGRFEDHKRNIYYADSFQQINDIRISHQKTEKNISKPTNYEKMIEVARKLSKDFIFVRVDLYNIDGKIYFGELTFYPGNCNERILPLKYEDVLGEMLELKSNGKIVK